MPKLLHTGDIHLGVKLSGLGRTGDRVRASIKNTFTRTIDLAVSEKVDAFLIAGDLFDSNRVSNSLLRFALSEIERLGEIPCILLPGNHDCLEKGSVVLNLEEDRPENLYIFSDPDDPVITLADKEMTFYGMPNLSNRSTTNPVAAVKRREGEGAHILLAHGSYMIPNKTEPDDHPFDLDSIENSGFDYVALGHWHSAFELPTKQVRAAYCGSPERLAFDQSGAGNVLLVDVGDSVKIEKKPVGETIWDEINLSTSNFMYTIEVERELQQHVGDKKLLRVTLSGVKNSETYIDTEEIVRNLKDSFLFVEVIDKTEATPGDLLDLKLPPTTILGQFIRQVNEAVEAEDDEGKKALLIESLRTGYALMSGKDVL